MSKEDETTTSTPRTPAGPVFFLGAMALYLFLVHGISQWGAEGMAAPLGAHPEIPHYTRGALEWFATVTHQSLWPHRMAALALLYGCMAALFALTRHVVGGPVWLGSLAGSTFMAHPVKTEVFFETIGLYYLAAALLALLATLAYVRATSSKRRTWYALAIALFAAATIPFTINAPLLVVLFLLEFYPVSQENRRWMRLLPFAVIAIIANGLHMDALYAGLPTLPAMLGPLLLLLYPIGLLPDTVSAFAAQALIPWFWGLFAALIAGISFVYVRNGAFRITLAALVLYRFFPGAETFDLSSLDGGGQLLVPLALGCLAFAGFSRWLMNQAEWGRPTVALTTMLCVVLFVLQFQANRSRAFPERSEAGDRLAAQATMVELEPLGDASHE